MCTTFAFCSVTYLMINKELISSNINNMKNRMFSMSYIIWGKHHIIRTIQPVLLSATTGQTELEHKYLLHLTNIYSNHTSAPLFRYIMVCLTAHTTWVTIRLGMIIITRNVSKKLGLERVHCLARRCGSRIHSYRPIRHMTLRRKSAA